METYSDYLMLEDREIFLKDAKGKKIFMPNLTALVKMYDETADKAIQKRIESIFDEEVGSLMIAEVMIDMSNEKTLERLRTGEISKTMRHVHTYNMILESHLDEAKALFEQRVKEGVLKGSFDSICFAPFTQGIVIERKNFPEYENKKAKKIFKLI